MNIPTKFQSLGKVLSAALLLALLPAMAAANVTLGISKSVSRGNAHTSGQVFDYSLGYSVTSNTAGAANLTLADPLPTSVELVSITGSAHTTDEVYDAASHTVNFSFIQPVPAGTTGQVKISVRFKSGTPAGTIARNTATINASNAGAVTSNEVATEASVKDGPVDPLWVDGVEIKKTVSDSTLVMPSQTASFYIRHGFNGATGTQATNYVVQDRFPAGWKLHNFDTGEHPGTSNAISVLYTTKSNSTWQPWPGSPVISSGDKEWMNADEVTLADGDYINGLRFEYGTVSGGGLFHYDNNEDTISVNLKLSGDVVFNHGDTVENTGEVSSDTHSASESETVTLERARPDLAFWAYDDTDSAPYAPGEVFRIGAATGVNSISSAGITDPNFAVLLPPELRYVGNIAYRGGGWENDLGSAPGQVTVTEDFNSTGGQLIRIAWPGTTLPGGDELYHHVYADFDVEVAADAALGASVPIRVHGGWQTPVPGRDWGMVVDVNDYDGDGDITDPVASSNWQVALSADPGSGAASVDSVMWVKGSLDSDWSRYPDNGKTVPSGQADYELRITNTGGVALSGLTLIDILPHIGDTGVITSGARGTEWEPFMAGEVTAPSTATVYYSESSTPERYELTPSFPGPTEAPNWTSTAPSDITTVKSIKVEFGNNWIMPGETVVIGWPMRAPVNAPSGGEIAWNSFAFKASRADDGVALLPAEPRMTGIAVQPAGGAHYGDFVWDDSNRNGMVDPGEVGINGVRVELYEDNGDGVADPATDSMVAFNVTNFDGTEDGKFLFTELDPGDYFSVVYAPDGMGVSISDGQAGDPSAAARVGDLVGGTGDFESGAGAFWSTGDLTVETGDGGPHAGTSYVQIENRTGIASGLNYDVTLNIEKGKTYYYEFYAKLENHSENIIAQLNVNAVEVHGQTARLIPGGWGSGSQWTKVSGTMTPNWSGFMFNATFNISPESIDPRQSFKIDDFRIVPIDDNNDSDGERAMVNGLAATIMPITTLGFEEHQLHWDQGFFNRSGLPAVWAIAEQADGSVVLGGKFEASHGVERNNIARVDRAGNVDLSFDPGTGTNAPVNAVAVHSDGRIAIGGGFSDYNGAGVNGFALLDSSGTRINVMQPNAADVRWLGVDDEDRLIVAGGFDQFGGADRPCIARLNSDGSLDSTFKPAGVNGHVNGVALLPGKRLAIAGAFTQVGGESRKGVAVLKEDGSLDQDFDPGTGANGTVHSVSVKTGGRLVLVGDFTNFGGSAYHGTVRLKEDGGIDTTSEDAGLDISSVRRSQ